LKLSCGAARGCNGMRGGPIPNQTKPSSSPPPRRATPRCLRGSRATGKVRRGSCPRRRRWWPESRTETYTGSPAWPSTVEKDRPPRSPVGRGTKKTKNQERRKRKEGRRTHPFPAWVDNPRRLEDHGEDDVLRMPSASIGRPGCCCLIMFVGE
jgi:hypothetical protein